jgi:class 3 adenylate cyclase
MSVLDKEQSAWLRRLRFPPELEREFQEAYAVHTLRFVRLVLLMVALANGAWAVRNLFVSEAGPGMFAARAGSFLVLSCVFGLTWSQLYRRRMQLILTVSAMLLVLIETVALSFGLNPGSAFPFFASVCFLVTMMTGWYLLLRLQLLPAVLVSVLLLATCFPQFVRMEHPSALEMQLAVVFIVLTNASGSVGCWFLEHSAREDFLLQRLLREERDRADRLLLNILPGPIAEQLKRRQGTIADAYAEVTVLFADLVDFTPMSAGMAPEETVELLNTVFTEFDALAERHGLEKIKTIGDAYMVVAGAPNPREDHAHAAAEMALDMQRALQSVSERLGRKMTMRVGIHSGPVVAGVIGSKKFIYDLWGDTVNLASRMESQGLEAAIQVSDATRERLKDAFELKARPPIHVKGRGEMQTYLLLGRIPPA